MNIKHRVRETWTVDDEFGNEFVLDQEPISDSLIIEKTDTGYKVKFLTRDELCSESPRDWDNIGVMLCFSRRHNLGDNHSYKSSDFDGQQELEELITRDYGKIAVILPLYLYDHSGITIATHSFRHCDPGGWDSGQVGVIFATEEKVIEEYGDLSPESIKKAKEYIEGEVKTYDMFLTGDVYCAVILTFDEDKNETDRNSCCGMYGFEYAMEALKSGNY